MVSEAFLVSLELALEMGGRLIEGAMGIGAASVCLEAEPGWQIERAFAVEESPLLFNHHLRLDRSIEQAGNAVRNALLDAAAQRLTHVQVFAGDQKLHDVPSPRRSPLSGAERADTSCTGQQ